MKIRHFVRSAALSATLILSLTGLAEAAPKENWIGAWGLVPVPPPPGIPVPVFADLTVPMGQHASNLMFGPVLLDNPGHVAMAPLGSDFMDVTIRQLVRVSVAGKRIRLRFSNEFNNETLALGHIHVALAGPDGAIIAGSDHPVTFSGHDMVNLPSAAPILSDPVTMAVKPMDRLLISIHVPGNVPRTGHLRFQYVSGVPGDQTASTQLPQQKIAQLTALVSEVDVDATSATGTIVALGDSITDGDASTSNAFRSWPDRLAERLDGKMGVVNTGIGGNRLLRYGTGPSALARLDSDVLNVPGVKYIILLEGINDIGRAFPNNLLPEPVTLESLIDADRQIIRRAHDHGIKVIGATLTPYQGAFYASAAGEKVREGLNAWILNGGEFDATLDFAKAVADPANPLVYARKFNDFDKLHPNDTGYKAIADAIDLKVFK